jgi:4-methyl-5(b-hydroxyethyl)-thiazole monophosphate biosynthesis
MSIIVPLASGFEEIEAITVIDILRRANLPVTSAAVTENPVKGAHAIEIKADIELSAVDASGVEAVILPGGQPGSDNLKKSEPVISLITAVYEKGGYIAAICAAPIVLAKAGILAGKKVTCFPGFQDRLNGGIYSPAPLQIDGKIITAEGPGSAMDFALAIVSLFTSKEKSEQIKQAARIYWM